MAWYYIENGEQRGPVADTDFEAVISAGKVTDESLVWREGQAGWQPWRNVRPKTGASDPYAAPTAAPSILGTGTRASGGTARVTEAEVRAREYEHDVGKYLTDAFAVFKAEPGALLIPLIVIGLCVFALSIALNVVAALGKATGGFVIEIPIRIVGSIVVSLLTGAFLAGLFGLVLRHLRGQASEIKDSFAGFGPRFFSFGLGRLVPTFFATLPMVPAGILVGYPFLMAALATRGGTSFVAPDLGGMMLAGIVLGAVGFCFSIYLKCCWTFTLWLMADKNMDFWPAMQLSRAVVRKHWWQTFLLLIVQGAINVAGLICCCVGLLVSMPVTFLMLGCAYERLFGDMESAPD